MISGSGTMDYCGATITNVESLAIMQGSLLLSGAQFGKGGSGPTIALSTTTVGAPALIIDQVAGRTVDLSQFIVGFYPDRQLITRHHLPRSTTRIFCSDGAIPVDSQPWRNEPSSHHSKVRLWPLCFPTMTASVCSRHSA
jgi:hypothetical protein